MKDLFSLLKRFSKSLNKDVLAKETIVKVIKNRTQIELKPENITLKDGVLEITSSPGINNSIKLKEEIIKKEAGVARVLYK